MVRRRLTGKAWLFRYLLHLLGPPQNRRFCGERRHSGTSEFCRLRRNERCETYADEVAPSETEGAGQEAGTFQVTAKADRNSVKWLRLSLFVRKSALFFWTVHGPFSFRQDEKKMGGGKRPSSPWGRNLPLWHFQREERGMGTFHSLGVLRETTRYFPPHSRRFRASSRAFRSSTP